MQVHDLIMYLDGNIYYILDGNIYYILLESG
jgi:hypothetical protein